MDLVELRRERYDETQLEQGVIEVGDIAYAPALMKTAAATEAMFLIQK